MEVVASSVTVVQGAQLVGKCTRHVIDIIRAYRNAETDLNDLFLRVEGVLLKTEMQINVVLDLSSISNERLLRFQEDCLDKLETKLHNALRQLEGFDGAALSSRSNTQDTESRLQKRTKLKYSFVKKRLQELLQDLESWHSIFDPSWYMITRLASSEVDSALEENSNNTAEQQALTVVQEIRAIVRSTTQANAALKLPVLPLNFVSDTSLAVPSSSLCFSFVTTTRQMVILDTTAYQDNADPESVIIAVRAITRLLSISNPFSLGFLKCLGVIEFNRRRFQYVFDLPRQSTPKMLRILLQENSPSLDAKLKIAKSLTRAITSLHTANFVHKNIRPETIILLADDSGETNEAYLVGFEQSRPHSSHSQLFADMVWYRNLYRHPLRQGLRPQEYYNMQHDIYSLGVCLLEVGVWTSFLIFSEEEPQANPFLDILAELNLKNNRQAALQIKSKLINMAKAELPSRMGLHYTDVTLSCLTCLDKGATNIFDGEEGLYDEDGIVIGVAFIEKILVRLESLKV